MVTTGNIFANQTPFRLLSFISAVAVLLATGRHLPSGPFRRRITATAKTTSNGVDGSSMRKLRNGHIANDSKHDGGGDGFGYGYDVDDAISERDGYATQARNSDKVIHVAVESWWPSGKKEKGNTPLNSSGINFQRTVSVPSPRASAVDSAAQSKSWDSNVSSMSWWRYSQPVLEGVSSGMSIDDTSLKLDFDPNHCQSSDDHGDNTCHYDWGEDLNIDYHVKLEQDLNDDVVIVGSFKFDKVIPYDITCKICGEPCILKFPVLELTRTIKMPPCPIAAQDLSDTWSGVLLDKNPIPGSYFGGTSVKGTVHVKDGNGEGNTLLEVEVQVHIK